MTKLFSPDVQSISIGPCNHLVVDGIIESCWRCEPVLRRRGFVAYRGQTRPVIKTAEEALPPSFHSDEEAATTGSEEDLRDV